MSGIFSAVDAEVAQWTQPRCSGKSDRDRNHCVEHVHTFGFRARIAREHYEACLAYELSKRALRARRQISMPLRYDDLLIEDAYRIDLLVDDLVVIEVKAVETVHPVHRGQVLSYLRMAAIGWVIC